jgi:uncharacterized spore protein YtfJ
VRAAGHPSATLPVAALEKALNERDTEVNEDLSVTGTEDERIRATMNNGLDRLMGVSADRVFAEPVRIGDRVVIPAASVEFSGGFGFGGDNQSNGGGGGGGHQAGRPVAIIEAGPEGVRVRPVIDFTRVGLTLVGAALTIWRASRR